MPFEDVPLFESGVDSRVVVTFVLTIHPVAGVAQYAIRWHAEPADADVKGGETTAPAPIDVVQRRLQHLPAYIARVIDEVVPPFLV